MTHPEPTAREQARAEREARQRFRISLNPELSLTEPDSASPGWFSWLVAALIVVVAIAFIVSALK